jgi:hypothetical protein
MFSFKTLTPGSPKIPKNLPELIHHCAMLQRSRYAIAQILALWDLVVAILAPSRLRKPKSP